MAQRIYLIEDDTALRTELAHVLELSGYAVAAYEGTWGDTAARALAAEPDCIVLDLKLPAPTAFHLPRHPGQKLGAHPHAHLLGKRVRRGHGHEPGGRRLRDQALSARRAARAPAGVAAAQREPCCRYDDPPQRRDVEHGCRTVEFQGRTAELTRNELRILQTLMRNPGVVVPRSEIMCALWESDAFIDDNTLTVNVNRLRKTLGSLGVPEDFLATRRGVGYTV